MHFVETQIFTKQITDLLDDSAYRRFQVILALNPEAGDVIRGGGGLRKIRWSAQGRGKRGGIRIIYYLLEKDEIYLLFAYPKNKQEDKRAIEGVAHPCKGGTIMKTDDFSELVASIKQAGEIRRGRRKPSRVTTIAIPDVQKIRGGLGLSQSEFALMIGVSPRTIQNWEQKRREPEGAAKALLMVAARNPRMVLEALHG